MRKPPTRRIKNSLILAWHKVKVSDYSKGRLAIVVTIFALAALFLLSWQTFLNWPGRAVQTNTCNALGNLIYAEVIGFTDDEIFIRLTNNSEYFLSFSMRNFELERYWFFAWREVPLRFGARDMDDGLDGVAPSSSVIRSINLDIYRQNLRPRRLYRARLPLAQILNPHDVVVEFYAP